MSRRIDPQEEALWARVVASVNPLHPPRAAQPKTSSAPNASPPANVPSPNPRPDRRGVGPNRSPAPPAPKKPAPAPPRDESLDGSWDRRLSGGRFEPDLVIDLHGLSRDAARHLLYRRVQQAEAQGLRTILVITGKGHMPGTYSEGTRSEGPAPADLMPGSGRPARGAIRADFPRWVAEQGLSGRIAAVRRAHPRHGGAGAAYLILKRRRA